MILINWNKIWVDIFGEFYGKYFLANFTENLTENLTPPKHFNYIVKKSFKKTTTLYL